MLFICSQLSGLLVLAVGLWLRFDPETVELLTGDGAPDTFFIGTCSPHSHLTCRLNSNIGVFVLPIARWILSTQ